MNMESIFNKYPNLNEAFGWNNYKIIEKKTSGICYIFCTGNILAPRKIDSDDWFIKHKDYFEWQNLSKNKKIQMKAGKIFLFAIFVANFI